MKRILVFIVSLMIMFVGKSQTVIHDTIYVVENSQDNISYVENDNSNMVLKIIAGVLCYQVLDDVIGAIWRPVPVDDWHYNWYYNNIRPRRYLGLPYHGIISKPRPIHDIGRPRMMNPQPRRSMSIGGGNHKNNSAMGHGGPRR